MTTNQNQNASANTESKTRSKAKTRPRSKAPKAKASAGEREKEGKTMHQQTARKAKAPEYPWYDDRLTSLKAEEPDFDIPDEDFLDDPLEGAFETPKDIYNYLDGMVWKQEEAKKAASVILYQCLHGVKSNALFIGPTGCGKTHIWRCLKTMFPRQIQIVDGSNLTQDGWKGSKKWKDLLDFPAALEGERAILVIDEADKMLAPKYARDENVSHSIQSEGLTLLEGTRLEISSGGVNYQVDTSQISFVLCGAFSKKSHALAEENQRRQVGFGMNWDGGAQAYEKPLGEQDLMDFGVMPEFLGRIQRIVSLQPMTKEDYYRMTGESFVILDRIRKQYGVEVRLTPARRRELAETAFRNGLGIRGMENRIRQFVDEAIFEDCRRRCFEF